jgi:hypothetical protein
MLTRFLTPADMERFEEHALKILGIPDPQVRSSSQGSLIG